MTRQLTSRYHWRILTRLTGIMLLVTGSAFAADRVNKSFFGVAIEGYDPVAYFLDAQATEGTSEFAYDWSGATWYFVSAEHRDLFATNPGKFAPQYGGYCVNGAAAGMEAPVDPNAWTIWQNKLYLSYSRRHRDQFASDSASYVDAASKYWK